MQRSRQRLSIFAAGATVVAMLFAGAMVPPAQAQLPNPWYDRLAPFPEPAEEVLSAVANDKLYVFAGIAPGWKPMGMSYEYDPEADEWTKKAPMARPSHHVAFTSHDGKIYAFGGFVLPEEGPPAWVPIADAWEYDPQTDSWSELAPMPTARGAAEAAVVDGKVYVIGGAHASPGADEDAIHPARPHVTVGTVEVYDIENDSWSTATSMPTPRNHHHVAAVNGQIYVIGGRIGAAFITRASNTDVVEVYDPATDTWGALRDRMPTARSAGIVGVHNGLIYVAGGEHQDRSMLAAFRGVEAYDPEQNRWYIMPWMSQPRHGLAGGVIGDRFYVVSGDIQSAGTGIHAATPLNEALKLDEVWQLPGGN